MSEAVKKIEEILKSEYSTQNYVELISEIFDSVKIVAPDKKNKEYSNFNSHIETYSHVGSYVSPDDKKIAVFEVQLKAANYVENSRSTQRSYARKLIDSGNCDAAIVAFFTPGDTKWRLSFVRLDYEMKFEGGKFKTEENLTPAKRYSFLVGKDEPCHTAISRFRNFIINSNYNPTLDEIEEAFSVEKVTKEFFDLYCEKFYQLQEYLESNSDFKEEAERCGFTSEQFAKKLMGQIVFLYFLQKKGWLGVNVWKSTLSEKEYKNVYFSQGDGSRGRLIKDNLPTIYLPDGNGNYKLNARALDDISDDAEELIAKNMPRTKTWGAGSKKFLRTIFDWAKAHKGHFYEEYLEPLFYDTLNRNRGAMAYCTALHCRVPFLSGGLFDPIDNYDWKNNRFDIPDEIFSNKKDADDRNADGILDIFDRYNFTMSEDEPMEREVAIDPEMLGKVFENLLDVKDRKSKGAFYTPREIVHYMCQESLVNYLVRKTGIEEDDIRDFILYGDFMKDEDTSKEKREGNGGMFISENIFKIDSEGKIIVNRLMEIDKALADVKVADPAVGSGAFPLGMMNEIVRARQNITAYLTIGMSAYNKRMIYQNERSSYRLKYETIKNCIYAVDIEPSAVDIAQLRLWLSLVIDDEINPTAQNELEGHRDPLPLPNLECNIICGNSLIDEFNGKRMMKPSDILGKKNDEYQFSFGQNEFEVILNKLLAEQEALFNCDDPVRKVKHKEVIQSYKDMIVRKEVGDDSFLDAYKNAVSMSSKPFIVWELDFARVFRNNGGFDIVIGNPPYVGESGHKEIFRPVAETNFGKKYYAGKMDFFYFFFHKGLDVLNQNGDLAFITTNYYPTATGAKILRTDFKNRTFIRRLINFNEVRVFESALGQHNMITFVTKDRTKDIPCRSLICTANITATSGKLKSIMLETDKDSQIVLVEQNNIYDGKENYIRQQGVKSSNIGVGSVIDKMAAQKNRLAIYADVNQGVVSGCDTVSNKNIKFIPDSSEKEKGDGIYVFDLKNPRDNSVINSFESGHELLRDFYKNSDISRYWSSNTATKKLIYFADELDANKYKDILSHLALFRPLLEHRLDAYKEHYHWTALHRARREAIFTAPKIVVPYRTLYNTFAYNDIEWFCRSDCYIITAKSSETNLFYLLGLLNSKLNYVWLFNRGKRKGKILELFQVPLSEIPIIQVDEETEVMIASLAKEITELKKTNDKADTSELEAKIDDLLYAAYNLSGEEINAVEEACIITK